MEQAAENLAPYRSAVVRPTVRTVESALPAWPRAGGVPCARMQRGGSLYSRVTWLLGRRGDNNWTTVACVCRCNPPTPPRAFWSTRARGGSAPASDASVGRTVYGYLFSRLINGSEIRSGGGARPPHNFETSGCEQHAAY